MRRLIEPMRLGGYTLPPDTIVAPCMHLMHRRADIYPDPLRFQPERFLRRSRRHVHVDPVRRRRAPLRGRLVRAAGDEARDHRGARRARAAPGARAFGGRRAQLGVLRAGRRRAGGRHAARGAREPGEAASRRDRARASGGRRLVAVSRFHEPQHPDFHRLNSSIEFDRRLWPQDVAQSRAHARMLAARGIISRGRPRRAAGRPGRGGARAARGQLRVRARRRRHPHDVERRLTEIVGRRWPGGCTRRARATTRWRPTWRLYARERARRLARRSPR